MSFALSDQDSMIPNEHMTHKIHPNDAFSRTSDTTHTHTVVRFSAHLQFVSPRHEIEGRVTKALLRRPTSVHDALACRDLERLFLIGHAGTGTDLGKMFKAGIVFHIPGRLRVLVRRRLRKETCRRCKRIINERLRDIVTNHKKETYRSGCLPQLPRRRVRVAQINRRNDPVVTHRGRAETRLRQRRFHGNVKIGLRQRHDEDESELTVKRSALCVVVFGMDPNLWGDEMG